MHPLIKLEKLVIVNVISTASLNQPVNIETFVRFGWGIYDNEIYGGVCGYVKPPDMDGKVIVFATGKMISVGARSISDSINQLNNAKFYLLQENLISDVKLDVKVRNIVSVLTLNLSINLQKLHRKYADSIYNPDNFAGLILKKPDKPTCLVFSSGKIVISGAKSESEIREASILIKKLLK